MSANTGGSRGVASFWKQPPLDVHSDVVIEQLIKETAQVPTVTTAAMEIKICNLYAPNNGKDSSAVFDELKCEPVIPMLWLKMPQPTQTTTRNAKKWQGRIL